ncbi:MAG: LysM peptidoglycan-binding domain-containing protein [Bacteroidales bacterium]|nr:LysM peptidoglycan-binding domain-containing protein [Bacteroidales bacterium]
MNLIYFIRLVIKNITLILGTGFFMAFLVFILTRNQPHSYSSETTIYTGIATGINLESGVSISNYDYYATSAKFDNLINLIKSRDIQEETALRLMAQHLLLEQPDNRICSEDTRNRLLNEIPREVLDLVVRPSGDHTASTTVKPVVLSARSASRTPATRTETSSVRVEKQRKVPKYYTVKSGDYPSAIARNFNISLNDLLQLNNVSELNLHGGQKIIVGETTQSYWVDSVVTRQVPVTKPGKITNLTNEQDYSQRMDSLGNTFNHTFQEVLSHVSALEQTYQNLKAYKEQDQSNYIYQTLQSTNPFYSVEKISSIKVARVQNSDLIRLSFESDDPGVCQQTLEIITEVFTRKFQSITSSQATVVSNYFRDKMISAKDMLDSLEQEDLNFRMKNRIINYDEQSRTIAEQKESVDQAWYAELGVLSAAKAGLQTIEQNMGDQERLTLQNKTLLDKRDRLYKVSSLIALKEADKTSDPETMSRLRLEESRLERELENEVNKAFALSRSTAGINRQAILSQWLNKAIEVEQSRARYNVLTKRKEEYLNVYDNLAPMGSKITTLNRQIELANQEYLDHLHNYNLSMTKLKNVEQSNLQVIDAPYYPLKPNPSKRMVILMVSFIVGLLLSGGLVIFLEFIDSTLKMPERAAHRTGQKLIGAFPKIPLHPEKGINYSLITTRLVDIIAQKIKLEDLSMRTRGEVPFLFFITSTRNKEGKTFIASRIVEKLRNSGNKVLYIKPLEKQEDPGTHTGFAKSQNNEDSWDFEYEVPDNFMGVKNINELLKNFTLITRGYQYILVELPALLTNEYPAALTRSGHMTILVCRANRTWNDADTEALTLYKSQIDHKIYTLLNGCQVDYLENIIGEIPKQRSKVRVFVKKLINLDFRTAKTL